MGNSVTHQLQVIRRFLISFPLDLTYNLMGLRKNVGWVTSLPIGRNFMNIPAFMGLSPEKQRVEFFAK